MLGARYKYRNRKEKDGKRENDERCDAGEGEARYVFSGAREVRRPGQRGLGDPIDHAHATDASLSRREKGTFINEYKREKRPRISGPSLIFSAASLEQAERQGSFVTAAAGSVPIPTTKEEKRSSHPD